jgi:hypothetical protein
MDYQDYLKKRILKKLRRSLKNKKELIALE